MVRPQEAGARFAQFAAERLRGGAARDRPHPGIAAQVTGGVEIRVTDNGHGIPEIDSRPAVRAFRQRRQGERNRSGAYGGTKDHPGPWRRCSRGKNLGEGTVFRLLLPLASSLEPGPEGRPGRTPLARTERLAIGVAFQVQTVRPPPRGSLAAVRQELQVRELEYSFSAEANREAQEYLARPDWKIRLDGIASACRKHL